MHKRVSRFWRSHLQRIWPYGRQHVYPKRAGERDRAKNVKELFFHVSGGSRYGHLNETLYDNFRSDGLDLTNLHHIHYSTYLRSEKICLN